MSGIGYKSPEEFELYHKAISLWGEGMQYIMAIEEMSELTKCLTKLIRNEIYMTEEIISELVDVEIMLEQLKIMLVKDNFNFEKIYELKLKRLHNLVFKASVKNKFTQMSIDKEVD